jgi:hypothetical protein
MAPTHLLATSLPRLLAVCALCLGTLVAAGCFPRGPVIGTGEKTPAATGTISGVVRDAAANAPLAGRMVTATEVTTGEKFEASTSTTGGYTMKVPTGRYRLSVELREGETVADGPVDLTLSPGDLDAARDFVITVKAPGGI